MVPTSRFVCRPERSPKTHRAKCCSISIITMLGFSRPKVAAEVEATSTSPPRPIARLANLSLANSANCAVMLELKLIADVGLIGKPNAGKSTLLSRLSRATPEIADYPFTTKYPNLGVVRIGLDRQFVLADIPGLIEGAHAGVGLGHEFLRHVERTKVLVHLVEPIPADQSDPIVNYRAIHEELRLYDESLITRPELVVVTKCELSEAAEIADKLEAEIGQPVFRISAVTGKGLPDLINRVFDVLKEVAKTPQAAGQNAN